MILLIKSNSLISNSSRCTYPVKVIGSLNNLSFKTLSQLVAK